MTTETDYLTSFFKNPFQLSMTATTAQRPRSRPATGARWEPGLASFAWSNLGSRRKTDGQVTGLAFAAHVWFSDRRTNPGASPVEWQQFAAGKSDLVVFTFTVNGAHVHLHADLKTWGSQWDADSFAFDATSEQLLFRVPGAGAGAPRAVMLTSFGPGAGIV